MVVDDDVDLLFSVQMILKKQNYEVVPLSDCTQAITTASQHQPDLILLDVNLGECDGRDICLKLKSESSSAQPILLFSANGEYSGSLKDYKADGFIQKPFSSAAFVAFINSYLNNQSTERCL